MTSQRPKKILIVEDEPNIAQLIRHYLEKEGFHPSIAQTGLEALTLAASLHPDLVILDLMLPQMDGFEACKAFRHNPETALLPIIMVTAKNDESDTIVGLELGADDYMTKPFSPKTLVARVKALLRRVDRVNDEKPTSLAYGPLRMDLTRHEVTVGGKEVVLTDKEFGLLEHLLRHAGRVLTREVLLNSVWGYDYYGTTRTVDVHVRRLKVKIPLLVEPIASIKSLGYKLLDQPHPSTP
jgi:two-component system, OmpR family, alkaline phosphatase synthesis response regulator PhoP